MSKRPSMLSSVVREAIAPLILQCPPEFGILSITDVKTSPDSSHVTLFVSALSDTDAAVKYLRGCMPQLKARLSGLHMRRLPELRIEPDYRGARGERIERLLSE